MPPNLTGLLDANTVPGGSQERLIMSLLGNGLNASGFQSLKLPLLALLLKGDLGGFDQQRANQLKLKRQLEQAQLQRSRQLTEAGDFNLGQARQQAGARQTLAERLRASQRPRTLEQGEIGPRLPPGFQVPGAASPEELQSLALEAGVTLPKPLKAQTFGNDREAVAVSLGYSNFGSAPREVQAAINERVKPARTPKSRVLNLGDRVVVETLDTSGRVVNRTSHQKNPAPPITIQRLETTSNVTQTPDPIRAETAVLVIAQQAIRAGAEKDSKRIKEIAQGLGWIIEGDPTVETEGGFLGLGGDPVLTGNFTIKQAPKVSTTTRGLAEEGGGISPGQMSDEELLKALNR